MSQSSAAPTAFGTTPPGTGSGLRTLGCGQVKPEHYGTEQTFAGWVHALRVKGSMAFLVLRDRTGQVQSVVKKEATPELFDTVSGLGQESVVSIRGKVQATEKAKAGFEVVPAAVTVLNRAESPLPFALWDDKIETGIDTRLDHRFLDLRGPRSKAIFTIRAKVVEAGSAYLRANGFTEIHTSNILGASSEGGTDTYKFDYFGRKAFLAQSPQLYKQMMMASGFDRVFEVGWYFRAEKHNTVRHLNESTAFDLEMAFIESEEDVMRAIEGLLHAIWKAVAGECKAEIETLKADVPVPALPFRRVPYEEALKIINSRDDRMPQPLQFGDDIGTEAEKVLGRAMKEEGHDFYFITKWPLAPKPFYVTPEDGTMDSRLCRGFDLDYRGVELISGGQRIHDPKLLEQGIQRWGLDPKDFTAYLEAFRYGMPPHGGCGLGIERILMQMLGLPNIREAILFPRDVTRLTP
ncbi:MAG TPA: aspartate--tRNA(Asn) ligase [Candidatus Thermoplasmatota archaeon]|nr:aspartate--tRNA(Asn) ligase [Candidatus Thermoplasmatota archaeon]